MTTVKASVMTPMDEAEARRRMQYEQKGSMIYRALWGVVEAQAVVRPQVERECHQRLEAVYGAILKAERKKVRIIYGLVAAGFFGLGMVFEVWWLSH